MKTGHQMSGSVGAIAVARAVAGLIVLAAFAGCASGETSGGAGTPAPAGGTGAAAGTGGAASATFTQVLALFGQSGANCGVCHATSPSAANGSFSFNSADKAGAHAAFVGAMSKGGAGSMCGAGKAYVVAGQPAASLLYLKLSATPGCGVRMPLGGMPLTDAQLQTVSAWITAGAKND